MLRVSADGGPGAITALLLAFAVPTVAMIPFAAGSWTATSRTVLVWSGLLQARRDRAGLSHGLVETLALVCVLQLGQAVAGPAWSALIPRIVGEDLVGRATGTSQALVGVATLAGSAVGGLLVGSSGDRGALLVDAAPSWFWPRWHGWYVTRRCPAPGAVREKGAMSAGLRSLFGDPLLRILCRACGCWCSSARR